MEAKEGVCAIVEKDGTARILGENNQYTTIADSAEKFFSYGSPDVSWNSMVLLKEDGTVWVKGHNQGGHLGTGDPADTVIGSFKKIMSGVKSISATYNMTAFLKTDGTLYMCGESFYCNYGNPDLNGDQLTPVPISFG